MKEVYLVSGIFGIFILMLVPVSPVVVDMGIYLSFLLAAFVLIVALVVDRPAEFLTFPVILIVSVVFRLGLNVASTRLIIQNGASDPNAAGKIINSIAQLVIGNSMIMGLLIFSILLVVNLLVINKGASRMAEVGARFTLDGVPGRQMAIDADLASGSISHQEAQEQRQILQSETAFFGSLDGAAKFIKGDAVAGIIITLLNLVMGTAIASLSQGVPVAQAFAGFATLTIGDGIVSQIPAVMISIAGAMLLSRSGARDSLSKDFLKPIIHRRPIFYTLLGLVGISLFMPGVPLFVALVAASGLIYYLYRSSHVVEELDGEAVEDLDDNPSQSSVYEPEVSICLSPSLMYLATHQSAFLPARIEGIKAYVAQRYGIELDQIMCKEHAAQPDQGYTIRIHGVSKAKGTVGSERFLLADHDASSRTDMLANEPVFGLAGRWVGGEDADVSHSLGADEIIATHLLEVLELNLDQFATFERVSALWNGIKQAKTQSSWHDELEQKIKIEDLLELTRYLLQENIGLRNFGRIVELLFRFKKDGRADAEVFELIRREVSGQVLEHMCEASDVIEAATLDIGADAQSLVQNSGIMSPEVLSSLVKKFQKWSQHSAPIPAILLVERALRRQVFEILHSMQIRINVMAFDEVPFNQKLNVIQKIEVS